MIHGKVIYVLDGMSVTTLVGGIITGQTILTILGGLAAIASIINHVDQLIQRRKKKNNGHT
jgi:hypothetical protein